MIGWMNRKSGTNSSYPYSSFKWVWNIQKFKDMRRYIILRVLALFAILYMIKQSPRYILGLHYSYKERRLEKKRAEQEASKE